MNKLAGCILLMLFPLSSYAVQKTQYTGRLDPELVAGFPPVAIRLIAATEKEMGRLPAVNSGESVHIDEIIIGFGNQHRRLKVFAVKSGDDKPFSYAFVDLNS